MNLVRGSLRNGVFEAQGDGYQVRVGGFGSLTQEQIVLGLRAEDIGVVSPDSAQITGNVFSFELLGDATTVTLRLADQFITAKAGKEFRATMGERTGFAVQTERCYLFDGQTQNRMRL